MNKEHPNLSHHPTASKRSEPSINSKPTEKALDSQAGIEHVSDETDGEMLDDAADVERIAAPDQAERTSTEKQLRSGTDIETDVTPTRLGIENEPL